MMKQKKKFFFALFLVQSASIYTGRPAVCNPDNLFLIRTVDLFAHGHPLTFLVASAARAKSKV
jgi:hypothetical protein